MAVLTATLRKALPALVAALATSCGDAPLDRNAAGGYPNHNAPAGRIEGTILYEGPAPTLDAAGRAQGRVVLLLFRADESPPPDGFATTPVTIAVIPASQVFQSATALPGGIVRATAPFVFPDVPAGEFQLRAFYSNRAELVGFHPLYGVRSQPQRGDVGGGAVVDPRATPTSFARIAVGNAVSTDGGLAWTLPEQGALARGVTVFLGAVVPTDRPLFRVAEMPPPTGFVWANIPARPAQAGAATLAWASQTGFLATSARALLLSSNLPAGIPDNPAMLAQVLPAFSVEVGLPMTEVLPACRAGVALGPLGTPAVANCDTGAWYDPATLRFTLGPQYRPVHPTLLPAMGPMGPIPIPWTYPLVLMVKLHEPNASERATLSNANADPTEVARIVASLNQPEHEAGRIPTVLFGTMVPDSGLAGLFGLNMAPQRVTAARVVVSPIAVQVRSATEFVPIAPKLPPTVARTLAALRPDVQCTDEGLPTGRYSITLVTQTGQTWSLPNELSPMAFPPNARIASASQGVVVRIDRTDAPAGYICPMRM